MNNARLSRLAACTAALLAGVCAPALAQQTASPPPPPAEADAEIRESNSYLMRLMLQTFDGNQEFSHTQTAGFARMRVGDESWVEVDFGNGAVVVEREGGTAASRFRNLSGVETGMRYNYATKTLSGGDAAVRDYHNRFVRPQLGRGPALGSDASWTARMTLGELGLAALGNQSVGLELSRTYFTHEGRGYVLLRYRIPSFTYDHGGRTVVQWGEGAALTDPGFGQMYWNAALQRAVAAQPGATSRPYRYAKTLVAIDAEGRALVDLRSIPQVAPLLERFYEEPGEAVLAFAEQPGTGDQTPLGLAARLDIMALSIAEDSANQLGELTGTYNMGDRGAEVGEQAFAQVLASLGALQEKVLAAATAQRDAGVQPSPEEASALQNILGDLAALTSKAQTLLAQAQNGGTVVIDTQLQSEINWVSQKATHALEIFATNPVKPIGASVGELVADPDNPYRATLVAKRDSAMQWVGGFEPLVAAVTAARRAYEEDPSAENLAALGLAGEELHQLTIKLARTAASLATAADDLYRDAVRSGSASDLRTAQEAKQLALAMQDRANRHWEFMRPVVQPSTLAVAPPSGMELRHIGPLLDASGGGIQFAGGEGGGGQADGASAAGGGGGGGVLDDARLTVELADKFSTILEGIEEIVRDSNAAAALLETNKARYEATLAALQSAPVDYRVAPAVTALRTTLDAQKAELAKAEADLETLRRLNIKPAPGILEDYARLQQSVEATAGELVRMAQAGTTYQSVPSARALELAAELKTRAADLKQSEAALAALVAKGGQVQEVLKTLSQTEMASLMTYLAKSPAGKVVKGVATGLNVLTIGQAAYNVTNAATADLSDGQQLALTRNYGSAGAVSMLGLEILSLAGNVVTGNIKGVLLDSASMTVGSVTDIIIAAKGVQDTNRRALEAQMLGYELELRQIRENRVRMEASIRELAEMTAEAKDELASFDEDTERARRMAEELLAERQRAREERERVEQEAREALIAAAKAENERIYQENLKRPPTPEEWDKFNRDIAEAIKPDYPTAPPPDPALVAARLARIEAERRRALEAEANAIAELAAAAAAEAARRQAEAERMAQIAAKAIARREAEAAARQRWLDEARNRQLETSALTITQFDVKPVEFKPPVWVPPVFEPPVWVPPQFDPPDPSSLPWTDFADDDWLARTDNLAFGFEDMSGRVQVDLGPWAEWLKTQDIRALTRLALQAGYPNLASALADAGSIIRLSQDEGYRRWALQAPSCGGYVGCGPSYLERWGMKSAIVALGDILNASRDIFSTGGLSDISISGLNLAYLLRDFGLEDGDIINIRITQFGKTIFTNNNFTLRNAGDTFRIDLRPGVAALEIFAVNEGFARPNTAEIKVENVVEGNATQSYSLATGEFATLRIRTNAPPRRR